MTLITKKKTPMQPHEKLCQAILGTSKDSAGFLKECFSNGNELVMFTIDDSKLNAAQITAFNTWCTNNGYS